MTDGNNGIKIYIVEFSCSEGNEREFDVLPSDTIGTLKGKIKTNLNIAPERQHIRQIMENDASSAELHDGKTFEQYNIGNNAKLMLYVDYLIEFDALCNEHTINCEKKYKYAGILFFGRDKSTDKTYFLLGKEAESEWGESGKFSDFGGAPNIDATGKKTENIIETIVREAYEETQGILGCHKTLYEMVKNKGKLYEIPETNALICVLEIPYSTMLTTCYNNMNGYLTKCKTSHPTWKGYKYIPTCPEGYCEKATLEWILCDELHEALSDEKKASMFRKSFLKSIDALFKYIDD